MSYQKSLTVIEEFRGYQTCPPEDYASLEARRKSNSKTTKKKSPDLKVRSFFLAARLGLEPRLTASKAAVLPLDDLAKVVYAN